MPAENQIGALGGNFRQKAKVVLICVLLVLATGAAYWQVGKSGFINFDDPDYVSSNPRVLAGLNAESIRWAFTAVHSSNWHPVTWMSHMLDCQIYGDKPAGHHATNLLLHIANSLLLFGLLLRMTGALWRSAMVAALFALHPLHVESVAWVSERKDVLSLFFGLLAIWAYVCYAKAPASGKGRCATWYALALVLFALGLMSKPMLVTLPCLLLLLDYWPLRRFAFAPQENQRAIAFRRSTTLTLVLEKLPFFALSFASCVATYIVQKSSGAVVSLENSPLEVRAVNAVIAYAVYLEKTFWPAKLAVFYPLTRGSWADGEAIGGVLVLIAVTGTAIFTAKKRPYFLVGWFWFLGTLVPVIGLVQVGRQGLADRYTYLPHIGLFIALVWPATELFERFRLPRFTAFSTGVAVLAALGILTARQVSYWHDNKTLFTHALEVTEGNYVAYAVLSNALEQEDNLDGALDYCQKALALAPQYPEALNTMGNLLLKQNKYEEALENYRLAAKADPLFADPHAGMGNAYMKLGKLPEAEAECRAALQLDPVNLPAMFCLATSLHNQGKLDEAAPLYRKVLALKPNLFTPRRYLGNVLLAQGKPDEAIQQYQLALKIRPNDADTHTVLGLALAGKNQMDEAVTQFTEAVKLQPTNAIAIYQLALVWQSRKQPALAVYNYRKALEIRPDWPEVLNNLAWLLAANPDVSVRDGADAVKFAERACELTQNKEAFLIGTLGAAYAEAGRFPEAIRAAEKARDIALAGGQKELAEKNAELLKLYQAGQPFHESQ